MVLSDILLSIEDILEIFAVVNDLNVITDHEGGMIAEAILQVLGAAARVLHILIVFTNPDSAHMNVLAAEM